jgi:hypothetical protein
MSHRIWEWGELTPEVVREWGYDDDYLLMEQDEDRLLYAVEFFPVLLELAGDDTCPKQEHAFDILCTFCREQVIRGGRAIAALRDAWTTLPQPASGRPRQWHDYVGRLLSYVNPMHAVDQTEARLIAADLLLGPVGEGRTGEIIEDLPTEPGWIRFTLHTTTQSEHIDICEATGQFSYIRHD